MPDINYSVFKLVRILFTPIASCSYETNVVVTRYKTLQINNL